MTGVDLTPGPSPARRGETVAPCSPLRAGEGPGVRSSRCVEPGQFTLASVSPLLECAPGDAFDEIVEEDVEQDRDGQAGDERPGHQLTPVVDVAAHEVGDHTEG